MAIYHNSRFLSVPYSGATAEGRRCRANCGTMWHIVGLVHPLAACRTFYGSRKTIKNAWPSWERESEIRNSGSDPTRRMTNVNEYNIQCSRWGLHVEVDLGKSSWKWLENFSTFFRPFKPETFYSGNGVLIHYCIDYDFGILTF